MSKQRPSLAERVTQEDLAAYLERQITARTLADLYSVKNIDYIYQTFRRQPKLEQPKPQPKSQLSAARRRYRLKVSLTTSARLAAEATYTSLRTMYRYRAKAKLLQAEGLL
jgi:AmiR/NasT family two-component response regulator